MTCQGDEASEDDGYASADGTSNRELDRLVELTDDLLVVCDEQGIIRYCNGAASRLHGPSRDELVGSPLLDYVAPHGREIYASVGRQARNASNHRTSARIPTLRADGSIVELWCHVAFDAETRKYYIVERDMTESDDTERELKRLNEELRSLATLDSLTGLLNRGMFERKLIQVLEGGESAALLFLDMDNFKLVNDTMGHSSGDHLLRHTANRLIRIASSRDIVARFGGDEFVMLMCGFDSHEEVMERAREICSHVSEPFVIGGRVVHSSCSVGIAIADPQTDTASDLIRNADIATYKAKDLGRSRFVLFDDQLRTEVQTRFETEAELRLALARNEISVALQGVFETRDPDEPLGFEALVRWRRSNGENVPPIEFVDIAEDCGLLDDITITVMTKSLERLAGWLREDDDRFLAVNVAPSQLRGGNLTDRIIPLLEVFDVSPRNVVIEITEVGLTGALTAALPNLERLRLAGFQLAIDDFGKGASSLGYLRDFPVTMVKIDGSFVHRLAEDEFAATITSSVIELANRLDMTVVAECVETAAQLDLLHSMGCTRVQGYLLHRPSAPEDIVTDSVPMAIAIAG